MVLNSGGNVKFLLGDCIEVMKSMPDDSVDSIVTDPPYELGFMGKSWDLTGIAFNVEVWQQALRVLKPGGHLLAFSGSRTYHRMAVAIEDAGFQIRDQIMWVYGSGFPKSHNVSKGIDKAAGYEGKVVGLGTSWNRPESEEGDTARMNVSPGEYEIKELSFNAQQWEGWGTALKPAHEPIVLARKPFVGTVANNVLTHGTGVLNIDGCRVEGDFSSGWAKSGSKAGENIAMSGANYAREPKADNSQGRWPANFIHDGSDEVVELLSQAARFFYCTKASKRDRNEGLDGFEEKFSPTMSNGIGGKEHDPETATKKQNFHPTVKPTDLMRYLCKLITPPNGVILDPFMGSGSTGKGAKLEGFDFIGIEQDADYLEIARARIDHVNKDTLDL
jgi:DNA modification methylase